MPPLDIIGKLHVPAAALQHRFVNEALACAAVLDKSDDTDHRVIGTGETGLCELYGWGASISAHRDCTGWAYLVLLDDGCSSINACMRARDQNDRGLVRTVVAERGDVVRLNDFHLHWTVDPHPRVAAFVSTREKADDEHALQILTDGINRLAAGDYYGAPRVREGFRVLAGDEVWVLDHESHGRVLMLRADAEAAGRMVIRCSECDAPAYEIDPHFPYQWDFNRCVQHRLDGLGGVTVAGGVGVGGTGGDALASTVEHGKQ